MPFCQNCGRKLAENEVCNCTSGAAPTPVPTPTTAPAAAPQPAPAEAPAPKPEAAPAPKAEAAPAPAPKPEEKPATAAAPQTPPPAAPKPQPAPAPAPKPAPQPAPAPQQVYPNAAAQQPKKKKTPVGLIIAIILIPIVLIVLLVVGILAAILLPAMSGYVSKSKISSANASASSISKAVDSSLTDLDMQGVKISGYYVVCSDKKNNYNLPENFDEDEFYKKMKNYYSDSEKHEWFAVVEYSSCTYAAVSEGWKEQLVGTYPYSSTADGPCYYDTYYLSTTKRTKASLTKLYNDAAKKVKQKAEEASYYDYY